MRTHFHPDERRGHVLDYNEQGMEADFFWCFEPDERRPDDPHLILLAEGDFLAILGDDGSPIFADVITARRRLMRPPLPVGHHDWAPPGVDPADWYGYFRARRAAVFYRPVAP